MQLTVSCIIVDDDEIDRLTTLSFAKKHSFLSIDGIFENADSFLEKLPQLNPEVLLLDIDMPNLSGLQLREKLLHIPACIFITSHADYAVESFEKDALDFLVKPIKADRFAKAMERLQEYLILRKKAALLDSTLGVDFLFIKEGHEQIKINLHEIIYLEALRDYTSIVTSAKKHCVRIAMGNLLKEIAFKDFIRIHRSYAVQKNYIKKIGASEILVNEFSLPIGRMYKDALDNIVSK